jgi:hypothetical protein
MTILSPLVVHAPLQQHSSVEEVQHPSNETPVVREEVLQSLPEVPEMALVHSWGQPVRIVRKNNKIVRKIKAIIRDEEKRRALYPGRIRRVPRK